MSVRFHQTVELTLQQAATQLGKSVRQVRYMIQTGKLPARKHGRSWRIQSDTFAALPDKKEEALTKQQHVRAAVEDALSSSTRRRYSFRDLRAAQFGIPLHSDCLQQLGSEHPATRALTSALEQTALGCHRYRRGEKLAAYQAARDEASRCACALAISGKPPALELLSRLEESVLPAITGLIRRCDRQRS